MGKKADRIKYAIDWSSLSIRFIYLGKFTACELFLQTKQQENKEKVIWAVGLTRKSSADRASNEVGRKISYGFAMSAVVAYLDRLVGERYKIVESKMDVGERDHRYASVVEAANNADFVEGRKWWAEEQATVEMKAVERHYKWLHPAEEVMGYTSGMGYTGSGYISGMRQCLHDVKPKSYNL